MFEVLGDNNPLIEFLTLIGHILFDHIVFILSLIVTVTIIFFSKNLIFSILHRIENLYKKVLSFFSSKKTNTAIKNHVKMDKMKTDIFHKTQKSIKDLSDVEKKQVSLQFLYNFPSNMAFKAIFDVAISENDQDIKTELICSMCSSAKENKWWDFQ